MFFCGVVPVFSGTGTGTGTGPLTSIPYVCSYQYQPQDTKTMVVVQEPADNQWQVYIADKLKQTFHGGFRGESIQKIRSRYDGKYTLIFIPRSQEYYDGITSAFFWHSDP